MGRLPPKEKATRPAGPSTATSRPGAWSGSPCSWSPRRRGVNAAGGRTEGKRRRPWFCSGCSMPVTSSPITRDEVAALYRTPILELIGRAAEVDRRHHEPSEVQVCVLLSVKTGGCPEDCGYCPQSAHFSTGLRPEGLLEVADVLAAAGRAKADGATRFCMGAAWREVRDNAQFDRVLEMIRGVKTLDLEACCTLGMLNADQARRLKEAGLDAYNHNLDSSEELYDRIISTRTYQHRLRTLRHVRDAGISVCCGAAPGTPESGQ